MGVFENLPYTNFHELNMEWIVKKIKELDGKTEEIDQAVIDAQTAAAEAEAAAASGRTKDWTADITLNSDYVSYAVTGQSHVFQQGSICIGCLRLDVVDDFGQVGNKTIIQGLPAPEDNYTTAYGVTLDGSGVALYIKKESDGTGTLKTDAVGSVTAGDEIFINLYYHAVSLEG